MKEKWKTINGDDLIWSMGTLGFEYYVDPLKLYLKLYQEVFPFSPSTLYNCLYYTCEMRGGLGVLPDWCLGFLKFLWMFTYRPGLFPKLLMGRFSSI
jgi:hypothetical protein